MLLQLVYLLGFLCSCFCVDLTYNVEEEKVVGTYIGNIATDSLIMNSVAKEDHNLLRFSQMQQTTVSLFRISEKTGKLYTAQRIDAESVCDRGKKCFKLIEVVVRKMELFLKLLIIKINVKDINDNKPEFPSKEIYIEFPENEPRLRASLPSAVDKDIGLMNSNVTYSLKDNIKGLFRLQTTTLSLLVERELDRESQHLYNLQVIAKDQGSPMKKNILNVRISVNDLNDNTPIFSHKFYNGSTENEAQELVPIVTVRATDSDIGVNGDVSYYLSSKTSDLYRDSFKIEKKTGKIFLRKKIMIPQVSPIQLVIEAKDGAVNPLRTNATVEIVIVDTKNNPPLILLSFVSTSSKNSADISEGVDIGSVIAYVKAIDVDKGTNGEVMCNLENEGIQLHQLGEKIYTVVVKEEIDREKNNLYNIIVSCHDKGKPPLSSESSFTIHVQDINDNSPFFPLSHYTVSLQENNGVGLPIAHVSASDADVGPNAQVRYFLEPHVTSLFDIDEMSGIITVKKVFNREKTASVEFYVFAKDLGKPSLTGSTLLSVKILDTNDESPAVSAKLYRYKVTENSPPKFSVGQINASDPDSGLGGELSFSLLHDNSYFPFSITNTGFIETTEVLDYERNAIFQFQVVVSDNGMPTHKTVVNVIVEVVDVNDNAPMFLFPNKKHYSLLTHYSAFTKNNITMLRAFDKDSGLNAFLKFEIVSGNEKQLFDLNLYSGVLSFRRQVTHSDYGTYNLECIVKDSGSPTLSSTVYISVILLATNVTSQRNVLPPPATETKNVQTQDSLLVVVLAIVTVFVIVGVVLAICYIRRSDRRNMSQTPVIKSNTNYANKVTVRESLPQDVASEIWKDLGKFKSNVLQGGRLTPSLKEGSECAGPGEIPECTVEYIIEVSDTSILFIIGRTRPY